MSRCFSGLGEIFQQIPKPVLGGAVLVMFGTVAATGIKILASIDLDRRKIITIAISLGLGLGVSMVPEALANPGAAAKYILFSPSNCGSLCDAHEPAVASS